MYTINKSFPLLIMLGILAHSAFGQQTKQADTLHLSLNEVWIKAERESRTIHIKAKEETIDGYNIQDSKRERLPEWNFNTTVEKATNIPIYENGLFSKPVQHDVIHTLYKVSTDFYLNLYNGNKLNLKIEQEKIHHQIAGIRKDEAISDIKYKAATLFLDLHKSYIFRSLVLEDITTLTKQLDEIKAFDKHGIVLKSDVLRAELDLSKRKLLLIQIENDILIANQKLNIIMGISDNDVVIPELQQSATLPINVSYNACLNEAFVHSYNYHISEQETSLSKVALKQVQANVRPKLAMYGEFYYSNPQIFLYPYNPYWYSLGIGGLRLSFPISSLYHNTYKTKAAKLEIEQEEQKHLDTEDQIRQQVKEAFLRYKEALVQIDVNRVNVEQAKENERIVKNTYFNQTSLITDLLDANVQVLQTKFELANAEIIAQNKYYLLQNIIGNL